MVYYSWEVKVTLSHRSASTGAFTVRAITTFHTLHEALAKFFLSLHQLRGLLSANDVDEFGQIAFSQLFDLYG